jgi:hypothetical protein
MAIRWYTLPIETIGTARGPKYLKWRFSPEGLDVPWGMMDYGLMPVCIAWADVSGAQHTALTANADVRHIVQHANIDNNVGGGAVNAIRSGLEDLDIPGNWVQATDTWRQVLRGVMGMFQFAQRVHGKFGTTLLPDGFTLDTTWSELPQGAKDILLETAAELGIDTSGATGSTTLRQIYKAFGDAWGTKPFLISGLEI